MTIPALRPYQSDIKQSVYAAWHGGSRNALVVSPTGSGKTVLFGSILSEVQGASAAIAHRQELVTQMSVALARVGVRHGVIAPDSVARLCVSLHMTEVGRSYYDPRAQCRVAGVDTLVRIDPKSDPWFSAVRTWVQDEAHHVLRENKWGKAATIFPDAYGLGVTATPLRADGKGLGRKADGLFDDMIVGPSMRDLINEGYLVDYRIFAPPSDVVYDDVPITAGGDYSPAKLRAAVHRSNSIVGDIVSHYLKIARGKLGITFAVDVEAATEIAAEYRRQGVPAEVVTANTPDHLRVSIMRRFKAGDVLQLVNVDLFGEGYDVPACDVVSFARKTESYGLYCQQFGRPGRLNVAAAYMANWDSYTPSQRHEIIAGSAKPRFIVIDHVGNVIRHGLPDAPREWTLDRREARSSKKFDGIPSRACPGCTGVYERFRKVCPYCSHYPEPANRSSPSFVDGDLFELDPAALVALRGEVQRVDGLPVLPLSNNPAVRQGAFNQHHARQAAQLVMRGAMGTYCGFLKHHRGHDDSEIQRIFYHRFGLDILSAMAVGRPEAEALTGRINDALRREGVEV